MSDEFGGGEFDTANLAADIERTGREHENMERRDAVSQFVLKGLRACNPTVDEDVIRAEVFGDPDNNIFSGTIEEQIARAKESGLKLRRRDTMLRLARYYVDNGDLTLPDEIVEITNYKQLKEKNFPKITSSGKKALIFYSTAAHNKDEVIDFGTLESSEEEPDVVLDFISEKYHGKWLNDSVYEAASSIAFKGAKNVFLRSPDVTDRSNKDVLNENFTISVACNGECILLPSPLTDFSKQLPWLFLEAEIVRQPAETTFAPTEVVCTTYERQGGTVINAHPDYGKVKIKIQGGKLNDTSGEQPLDPRYFEVTGDEDYERRQQVYMETILRNQLGVTEGSQTDIGDDRSEKEQPESHSKKEWQGIFEEEFSRFQVESPEIQLGENGEVEGIMVSYEVSKEQYSRFRRRAMLAGWEVKGEPLSNEMMSSVIIKN